MIANRVLAKFHVKIVNSKPEYAVADIKNEIAGWERRAKAEGAAGLILLAGNQLSLGVTLPMVDVVMLMNDVYSGDRIIQMMFRCMTERVPSAETDALNTKPKRFGVVVDLNIARVVNTLQEFPLRDKSLTLEQRFEYIIKHNLICVDADLFRTQASRRDVVMELVQAWRASPNHSVQAALKRLEDLVIEVSSEDQKHINRMFTRTAGVEGVNVRITLSAADQKLPSGATCSPTPSENGNGDEDGSKNDTEDTESTVMAEINISLTRDLLPVFVPLLCILVMGSGLTDFMQIIAHVAARPDLRSVCNDHMFVLWNKPDMFGPFAELAEKYVKNNVIVYETALSVVYKLMSLIDRPDDLLKAIDGCLKPKLKEKQEHGEVFTPMPLVFEMLDRLDAHFVTLHGRSVFSDPTLKWFDPASGMGNFPAALYLRLMSGLDAAIPDSAERKKHILEKMIFMSELNTKNVFVCRQIFDAEGAYALRLHQGDSLALDPLEKWGVPPQGFDVVLGNPPYNKGGIRSHTGAQLGAKTETIWTRFTERALGTWLAPGGFLVFITPLSWLKRSHSLHTATLERHVVWLKVWDCMKSKATIHGEIPISLYVLHNIANATHAPTEITSEINRKRLVTHSLEYLDPALSVPLAFHSIFRKLAVFIAANNCALEYHTKTVKATGVKQPLPSVYALTDGWAVDTYTLKDGIVVKRAVDPHPDTDKRKLVVANKRGFRGAFVDDGRLALTGNDKFYILGDNVEIIQKMLGFGLAAMVSEYTKYRQDFLEKESCNYIPDLRKMGITDISEREFYELVGLTADEIGFANPELAPPKATKPRLRIIARPRPV
jgi:hypothetical protein